MKKQYAKIPVQVKGVDKENATLQAVFSTDDQDRHRDIVKQNFDLKQFKKNPVLINSHNYSDATEVIGTIKPINVKEGKLQGKIKFAVMENPKAKIIFDLYAGGFLNAFSIGFIPLEVGDDGSIEKSELLEVSAVSVPANAMALAKSKGIEVDGLDEEDIEECKCEKFIKDEKGLKCEACGKYYKEEKKVKKKKKEVKKGLTAKEIEQAKKLLAETEKVEQSERIKKLEALKSLAKKREEKRNEILKEILAVTRQLQQGEVDSYQRKQKVNRIIRQALKIK